MNIVRLLKPKAEIAFLKQESTLRQGLEKMRIYGYSALPVVNAKGEYVGTVSEGDFLRDILESNGDALREQEKRSLSGIIRPGFNPAVTIDTPMDALLDRVMDSNFVPVVDDRNVFMGIITRRNVLSYFRAVQLFNDSVFSLLGTRTGN